MLIVLIGLFGLVWLGRRVKLRLKNAWSGKEQISLALETENNDVLILTLTPAKEMVVLTRIPSKTRIQTPWFGDYPVGKLSLLVEQEQNKAIFKRGISYFLGLPVDYGFVKTGFSYPTFELSAVKRKLINYFLPPRNITFWRVWRYLSQKDLVWEKIDLKNYGQKDYLPDNTEVFLINPEKIDQQFWGYFSDPVVKKEGLTLSVFNVGGKSGVAKKISALSQNMGIRVVEVGDLQENVEDCLILLEKEEFSRTYTVKRLQRVLGCQIEIREKEGLGDIKLLIKNVKI